MTQRLTQFQYDTFDATRTHIHENGLATMPTSGVFPLACQVVALHGGLDYDLVAYVATCRGAPPKIPSPKTTNPNRIFLKGGRAGKIPIRDIGGIMTYTVAGWLLFGILSPEGLASDFMLGSMPFPGININEQIPGSYFDYSIINQNRTQTLVAVPNEPPLLRAISGKG